MMVVDNFNGWFDLGLFGGWWSRVWVRKREIKRKREERWKRRK